MNIAKIWMVFVLAIILIVPAVSAGTPTPEQCKNLDSLTDEDACECVKGKIRRVIDFLTIIAGSIAVIAAIVVGIMFMNAGDPSEKDKLGAKLKALIVGIVIVALANPVVRLIFGSIMECSKLGVT